MHFWRIPFVHWSRTRHIACACLAAATAAALCTAWGIREDRLLDSAQTQLDDAKRESLQNLSDGEKRSIKDSLQRLLSALPYPSIVDALQADISRFAEGNRVQLVSLTTEHASVAAPDTPRIVLQVSVRGDYAGIKSWLSELLARYPTLSLQLLQIQNASQESASGQHQEARVTLVLYVRAH
jgi:Tfp pilus assembly protein PilO